jgi:pyruvate,orthophosphate dikinase
VNAAPETGIHPLGPLAPAPSAALIGFKAHNLARMARIGLPVPEGFVLGTGLCNAYLADTSGTTERLRPALDAALRELERSSGLRFGDPRRPLLVSVRSGAPVSMPGMMDTLLDVGLTQATLRGLLRRTGNPRLAWDSYRRLIQSFAETVHGAGAAPFDDAMEREVKARGLAHARELDFSSLAAVANRFLAIFEEQTGAHFPEDPRAQLDAAIAAVFQSWHSERAQSYRRLHRIGEELGTAVTVQRMVFGNAGGTSGAGVAFTRDPSTGENRLYVDFLFNSQGEDVVSGRHRADDAGRLAQVLPEVWRQLGAARHALEREFGDAQEFEFTVQEGRLYLLQSRTGKRTPWAALRIAVEQVQEGLLEPRAALEHLSGLELAAISRTRLAGATAEVLLATAVPASAGVASGPIALDTAAARNYAAEGRRAVLVREDTSTEDIDGIAAAAGLLAARGSRTAHAAVVARQMGTVCLVGCDGLAIDLAARRVRIGERRLAEGEPITLDANEGRVYEGALAVLAERPHAWLAEVAKWSDALSLSAR